MFGKVTKNLESVVLGGSVKVGFAECVLAVPKASEQSFVCGESGIEVGSVLGELPSLSLEFEVVGNERPVE